MLQLNVKLLLKKITKINKEIKHVCLVRSDAPAACGCRAVTGVGLVQRTYTHAQSHSLSHILVYVCLNLSSICTYLSICQSIYLSIRPPIQESVYLSIYLNLP